MKKMMKAMAAIMLIVAVICTAGCKKDPKIYNVSVSASPSVGGVVTGSGAYEEGQSCSVTAAANDGYMFVKWTENGEVVSTDATYTFTVNAIRSLVAVFAPSHFVNATVIPSDGGVVEGGGTYPEGGYCMLEATANQGYTFNYWTVNGYVVSACPYYSFIVTSDVNLVANFAIPSVSPYIDLGLPSGALWATWNVGAATPEGFGDYFAWGETTPKDVYTWDTYQFFDYPNITKYTGDDDLTTLLPEDDAATAIWGSDWRIPTKEEWNELLYHTTNTWTTQNGVYGRLFTASNGATLFLPAAGYRSGDSLFSGEWYGYYWSSSLYTVYSGSAWSLGFFEGGCGMGGDYGRYYGPSVRPVRSARQN